MGANGFLMADSEVQMVVQDDGKGMSSEEMTRLDAVKATGVPQETGISSVPVKSFKSTVAK
jgi:hypothetical protein